MAAAIQDDSRFRVGPLLSKGHRFGVLAGLVIPLLGVVVLAFLLVSYTLSFTENAQMIVCAAVSYLFSGFGITVGYHRLFTHQSFQASTWLRRTLAIAGSSGLQGPILNWVADHKKHHAFSDKEGDPHSPHGHGSGWWGTVAGLWHAHWGWLLRDAEAPIEDYAKKLSEDPFMKRLSEKRWYLSIVLLRLAGVPALLGFLITGSPMGVLYGIAWVGLVPACLLLQFTFAINSVCHRFGKQKFATSDKSKNVWWLALLTLGESWHNSHHAFQNSYRHGLGRCLDLSAELIVFLEKLGLVWDVRRISQVLQEKKIKVAA